MDQGGQGRDHGYRVPPSPPPPLDELHALADDLGNSLARAGMTL
jgi:hypothetical protein